MKKGMFYLLPLLVFSQAATSTPNPQVDNKTVLVSAGIESAREAPAITRVTASNATPNRIILKPATGRVPRSGRNNRVSDRNRTLIRR